MKKELLDSLADTLQRERRTLLRQAVANDDALDHIVETRESELEEAAQQERDAAILENLDEREQRRIADIDAALARMEAETYGRCDVCGREIEEERLRALPTTTLCSACAQKTHDAGGAEEAVEEGHAPNRLPPDLDGLDDEELTAYLTDLVRDDGHVDMHELQISARDGVVYLEGALPSEAEREILLNILTDTAGVQEIEDHLEVERLAWERSDRWKDEPIQDVQPGTIPNTEPYAGTDDVILSNEEGVNYEPPVSPPAPPNSKE